MGCAPFGETRAGVEGKVPGVRAALRAPSTVECALSSPGPGSLEAFPSGTANPAEPPLWPGALWLSAGRWEREAPGASRRSGAGGAGALCLVLRQVWVSCRSRVLT